LVGTAYPVYWTMKAIESKSNEDKQWLTYWVVFACFTIIDMFSGYLLKFIPFYFFLKIVFLIWLFMPNSQGSYIIYHLLVVRVFRLYEQDIDKATEKLTEITKNIVNSGQDVIKSGKDKLIEKAIQSPFIENTVKEVISKGKKKN
jgi:receptor expression-enhancing protein 5/6